jgi:hypothetical protein
MGKKRQAAGRGRGTGATRRSLGVLAVLLGAVLSVIPNVALHGDSDRGVPGRAGNFVHGRPGLDYLGVAILRDGGSRVMGMAATSIKGGEQGLALTVWGLRPGKTYALVIDGSTAGELAAMAQGLIQVEYWSTPTGGELQLPGRSMPVSRLIHAELQNPGGTAVASGDFQIVVNRAVSAVDKARDQDPYP